MLDTEALHRIGIDTEEGIAYCADDPEFYEDMLREYLQESDGRAADLRRFYALQDWAGLVSVRVMRAYRQKHLKDDRCKGSVRARARDGACLPQWGPCFGSHRA